MTPQTPTPTPTPDPPWARQPGEPNRWYDRFEAYRLLGPRRSVHRAYHTLKDAHHLACSTTASYWYVVARRWNWQERAEAWDELERQRLRELEAVRREDARNARIDMIDLVLTTTFDRLLPVLQLPREPSGRANLTDLRLLFGAMLQQQRAELPIDIVVHLDTGDNDAVEITADDLLAAQRRLERWRDAIHSHKETKP